MIITRIPPSPTGMFHVGSLRTALYDYLVAKKAGGKFLLRIEDTDRTRLVDGATENIVESLYWGRIEPDEGVKLGDNGEITEVGEDGPYVQSKRLDIYEKYIQQLLDAGHAYYAFDTAEELDEMRKRQQLNKQPPKYDRMAMNNEFTLGKEETLKKVEAGESYVVRMRIPENQDIVFTDLVRGEIKIHSNEIDDQILRKSDGFPTYHLAVVVDDNAMKVTHVLRGEEWISSTPKHILLYQFFGWKLPAFGHLPLIVNEKGAKLSKRHGDVAVKDFAEKGYLPEAMINFVAFLGWNPGTEQEIFSLEELVGAFDISKVQKKGAYFNREKLDWFNQQWIRRLDIDDLGGRCVGYLVEAGLLTSEVIKEKKEWIGEILSLQRDRMTTLGDVVDTVRFFFILPEYDKALLAWKKSTLEDAQEKLELILNKLEEIDDIYWNKEYLEEHVIAWIKENNLGVGDVLWPTRVALSGQKHSPGPFDIAGVLGKEQTLERIGKAIAFLS